MNDSFSQRANTYLGLCRQHAALVSKGERIRHFLPWLFSLREGRSPVADQNIWIVFRARAFLEECLKPGMTVFEYGMGGSTLFFLRHGCNVCSVEHNPDWYQLVAREIEGRKYRHWRGFLCPPDSEPVAPTEKQCDYRSDFGEYCGRSFSAYVKAVDQFPDDWFDLVCIDGRARQSCFVHARAKLKLGGNLILDNSERARYEGIHQALRGPAWEKREFFGPGPYVANEFWGTTVWTRKQ